MDDRPTTIDTRILDSSQASKYARASQNRLLVAIFVCLAGALALIYMWGTALTTDSAPEAVPYQAIEASPSGAFDSR